MSKKEKRVQDVEKLRAVRERREAWERKLVERMISRGVTKPNLIKG